jgi:hypothetical protein
MSVIIALAALRLLASGDAAATAAPVAADLARLYGATAELAGATRYDPRTAMLLWTGDGTATWQLTVPRATEFDAALCYASGRAGAAVTVGAGNTLTGSVRKTRGPFHDDKLNFERVALDGKLVLPAGTHTVRVRIGGSPQDDVRVRSLELTAVTARDGIEQERRRARASRSSTDWLVGGVYGVMFHWTSQSKPRRGPAKPYAEAVASFDVPAFVDMVEQTGAAHVILTVNHADPHCPAPIQSWERVHPGMTTRRDLIGEIADGLIRRKVRLLLYFASHTLGRLGKVSAEEYFKVHEDVLTEFGERYRERIAGYWFDGWYQGLERYPGLRMDRLRTITRVGNPDRLVAYNFWIFPVETEWQDYWAGEVGGPVKLPAARYIEHGAGRGLQDQSLWIGDAPWVHSTPDAEMEPPRFSDAELIEFVQAARAKGSVVTINLGIFQDGSIGPAMLEQMRRLRRAIRGN